MLEQWVRWVPIVGLAQSYRLDSISDNIKSLNISLSQSDDSTKKLTVCFKDSVYAYKTTYESFRQKIIHDLDVQYGDDFYIKWSFFTVTHSEYLRWLSDQSYGITDELFLMHFSILTAEYFVDIVAVREPEIILIN